MALEAARRRFVMGVCGVSAVMILAGCGAEAGNRPSELVSPTPGSSAPSEPNVSPTEKSLDPSGPNSFTPTVRAPRPATALPGNVRGGS